MKRPERRPSSVTGFRLAAAVIAAVLLAASNGYCEEKTEKIAVVDFVGYNILQMEAASFSDYLRIELMTKDYLSVVSKEKVTAAIRNNDFAENSITTKEDAIKLAKYLEVDKVIIGNVSRFTKLGDYYFISSDIIDVKSERVYLSQDEECSDKNDFRRLAEDLAEKISDALGYEHMNRKATESIYLSGKKKSSVDTRYRKFGFGAGYPYLLVNWGFYPNWSIEPRVAFGSGIYTVGSRLNYIIKKWTKIELYSGFEYHYVNFDTEDIEGTGSLFDCFMGTSYHFNDKLMFELDMGPAYIYLKEKEKKYSKSYFGDIIVNMTLKYFIK
ncbi:MAG: hypothetical protein JXJ19_08485 [Elusimicrobia bacterium]|nr:hypothetical protein [Elusimicrobiota bacterium]